MKVIVIAILFVLFVAWRVPCAVVEAAAAGPIRLVVRDELGVGRKTEMVCSGVPFARGALQPAQPMHVETENGRALATQTKVLGRWPDGSVKWLLVQFSADCPAKGQGVYRLVRGQGPSPKQRLVIKDGEDRVEIDTGPLRVTVPKTKLTVFGEAWLRQDGREVRVLSGGTPMRFELADGTVHGSAGAKPEKVMVEESGPLRSTVHVVGWLVGPGAKRLYKLDARLRFYAGRAYVRADYTFICLGQPSVHPVKEITLDLSPATGRGARFVLPGESQPTRGTLAVGQTAVLSVDTDMVCRVGLDGDQAASRKPLDGWGLLAGDNASVGVAVRDFRHLCPKAIELGAGRIRLALWSARAGTILKLGRTRAKTHRVLYDFGPARTDERARLNRLEAFQQPLIATTPPEYFCKTDALGPLSPAGAPETAEYDKKMWQCFHVLRTYVSTGELPPLPA